MRSNFPVTGIERPMRDDQSLISRTDTQGNITYVNQDFIEISGFSEEELLDQPHNLVRHPDMPVEAFADLWATLKSGKSWTGVVKNRCKSGDHYWVLANATPIRENGILTGYTSVRTAPSRAQIEAAAKIYAKFKEGNARGLRIHQGQVVRTGPIGLLAGLLHLNIRGKLFFVMGMMSLFMLAIGALGLVGINASNAALRSVYEDRAIALGQLDTIVRLLNLNRLSVAEAVIKPGEATAREAVAEIEKNMAEIDRTWQAYLATYLTPEEKKLAGQFEIDRKAFVETSLKPAIVALRSGNFDEARRLETEIMPVAFAPARVGVNALIKLQLDVAKQETEDAYANYAWMRNVIIAMIAMGFALGLALTIYLVRTIVAPLVQAVDVAKQIAAGNLTARIDITSGDETGQMLHTLNVMKKSLTNIIGGVYSNAEQIGTGSAEIAVGNADLSQRTEEQASALEETAASMEELTSTVKNNAENSLEAKQLTHAARDIAVEGGEAMGQVVDTMGAISASSKKITEIIAVIDGIAFQTNILALNAAVEAARAGEQGRGFAVVAAEVRNLAQRSAAAAKEIKDLISDSVSKIASGATQVSHARATMEGIADAVQKVTDIMSEIAAASHEQSSGIGQVSEAVMQMDQVTQQNAALVEQSAAAAEALQMRSAALLQSVGVFKLGNGQA